MGIIRKAAGTLRGMAPIALALTVASFSAAASAAEALDLRYGVYFGGFRVADATLRYEEQGADGYRAEFDTRARGLVDLLVRHRSSSTAEGLRSPEDDRLAPSSYRYHRSRRNGTGDTEVAFDPERGDVIALDLRKRGKAQRTEVPAKLQVDVVDPLTAIFSLRRRVADALAGLGPERFGVAVFDGKRRYDIEAELLGRGTVTLGGRERPVVEVKLTPNPLAGFDPEDEEYVAMRDAYVVARLSDDERLVPVQLQTYGTPVTAVIRLDKDCSGERCAAATPATN